MNLIWDSTRLFIAGPDTKARWHSSGPNDSYVGLRFSSGLGPRFLGTRADEVRDICVDLDCLWSSSQARTLTEQTAGRAEQSLERWLVSRAPDAAPSGLGRAIFAMAASGTPVTAMADRIGYGMRQLHRCCLPLFGYGPQYLTRVLRFGRALNATRSGVSLAQVAVTAGFADQAHLSRDVRNLTATTPARLVRELTG
jgi:AraC-like DNA-binding protein